MALLHIDRAAFLRSSISKLPINVYYTFVNYYFCLTATKKNKNRKKTNYSTLLKFNYNKFPGLVTKHILAFMNKYMTAPALRKEL